MDGEALKGPQFVLGNGWRRTVFEFWQREQKFRKGQVAQCCEFEAAVEQFGIRRQVKASTLNFAVADRGHQQILASVQDVLKFLGVEFSTGFNVAMLLILFVGMRFLAFFALKHKKSVERSN